MFKSLLLIVFLLAVISLFSGLSFLIKDKGDSHRIINALYLRVFFCALLFVLMVYGFFSGQLVSQAPWL